MTTDIDVYRSAKLLIKQHGEDAEIHASMRADKLLEAADMDGQRAWLQIIEAIKELQSTTPTGAVH